MKGRTWLCTWYSTLCVLLARNFCSFQETCRLRFQISWAKTTTQT